MSEIKLNHVINGTEVAIIDGNYAQDINLFPSISSNVTALCDTNYYKVGVVPPGTNPSDAVNLAQLNSVSSSLSSNISSLQGTVNTQAMSISTLQNNVGSVYFVGDYKSSCRSSDHGLWLLCNGRAVSRITYANLFALIGTSFGVGDGSTTFNLPNALGRSPLYVGQGLTAEGGGTGTNRTLGSTGGVEAHALTIAEMPAHSHTYTTQTITADASLSLLGSGNRVTASPTANTSTVGSGTAHSIMHPWLALGSLFIYTG